MAPEGKKTPGLDQSVQDFKAQPDRDPEKLNDDVKVKFIEKFKKNEIIPISSFVFRNPKAAL